jgi:ribonuclease HI
MIDQNKQLNFLEDEAPLVNPQECDAPDLKTLKIYIDGAARKNPGPAGSGVFLKKEEEVVFEQGFFLGDRTNNQAEYFALLLAVFFIEQYAKKGDSILIYSDSQLLVRQMLGMYVVRDATLKKMKQIAQEMLVGYNVKFCHVYREQNQQADLLANRGIDKKTPLPKKFLDIMKRHGI